MRRKIWRSRKRRYNRTEIVEEREGGEGAGREKKEKGRRELLTRM